MKTKQKMRLFMAGILIVVMVLSGGAASVFAETLSGEKVPALEQTQPVNPGGINEDGVSSTDKKGDKPGQTGAEEKIAEGEKTEVTADPILQKNQADKTIRILHTNDTHGRYQYQSWISKGESKNNAVLGFDRLKTLAKGDTKTKPANLILDAGDTFHGQAFATLEQGSSTAEVMKEVGYTATTPGNHDFNYTADVLKNTLEPTSGAKILSCNIKEKGTDKDYFTPYMVKESEGVKIGILGITSPDIYDATAPRNVADLEFVDPIEPAKAAVEALKKEGCTVIIALAHMGNSTELTWKTEDVAQKVDGIDLIVDGHTHVEDKRTVKRPDGKNTLIVQTGYAFKNAGEVNLTLDENNQVTAASTENEKLITYNEAPSITPDTGVSTLIKTIETRQQVILGKEIGTTPEKLDGKWETIRYQQTNMGNVVADTYLYTTGADIAFENAGGMRKESIEPGQIIQKDIIDLAPYGNYIVTKKVTGQTILDMLEVSLQQGIDNKKANDTGSDWPKGSGSFLQWGGIEVVQKLDNPKGQRVITATVAGVPLDLSKEYIVATNSMVADSSDYLALKAAPEINQYGSCDESITTYIEQPNNGWQKSLSENYFLPYIEPVPVPTPTPVVESKKETTTTGNPQTGTPLDNEEAAILSLILLAIAGTCGVYFKKRQL